MKSVTKWLVLGVISGLLLGAASPSSPAQCSTTNFVVTDGRGSLTAKIFTGPKKPPSPPPTPGPRPRPH
jgi:hypothetical protein